MPNYEPKIPEPWMCDSNVSILYTTFPHLNSLLSKVVNTVLVPAGMYRTSMYTSIETSIFHTGLNTGHSKVINTVPVPAGIYCTGMYTSIKTSTFRTGLNTSRTGHVLAMPANFKQYRQVHNFFFFKVL